MCVFQFGLVRLPAAALRLVVFRRQLVFDVRLSTGIDLCSIYARFMVVVVGASTGVNVV